MEIYNLDKNHIAVVKLKDAKIIQGYEKIIHSINITSIELTINDVTQQIIRNQDDYADVTPLLTSKINDLKTNLKLLRPSRTKRWDALGRAWKWLSGSPDAEDLRIITTGIDEVVDNNNAQIQINNNLQEKLENITISVKTLASIENSTSQTIFQTVNLFNIILNIDSIKEEIATIQNSILLSKINVVNHNQLNVKEIELVHNILNNQGISSELLQEALGFATSTIGTNGETILYIVNIPVLCNLTYEHLRIEPVIFESQRIKLKGHEYLYCRNKLFLKQQKCDIFGNWTLCNSHELEDISNDECLINLMVGKNGKCTYETVLSHKTVIEMNPTTLLLSNINETVNSTCGKTDRHLIGSFLLLYNNCSISINNNTFSNRIIQTAHQPIFTPTVGLKVQKNPNSPAHRYIISTTDSSETS